ncbi:MAG: hypothetical protein K2F83_02205, partial [Oscillospiraceae bacterium]|nr:hypothetical protein [Oscillospiraceae bacterium]
MPRRSGRAAATVALVLLALSLIPLLQLAPYAVPMADDFGYGVPVYLALERGQSLLSALWDSIRYTYAYWQGTYSSVILFSLHPGVFSDESYVWTCYAMLGAILLPPFLALWQVKALPRPTRLILGSLVALVSLQWLPSPGNGIFWWNGAAHYVSFWGASVVATVLQLHLLQEKERSQFRQRALVFLACLAAFWVAGGNYCTALVYAVVAVALTLYPLVRRQKPVAIRSVPVSLCAVGGLVLNITAPGNSVRQALFAVMTPTEAIFQSFAQAWADITVWTDPWMVLALILGALLFVRALPERGSYSFPFPPVVILGCFCLYSALYTPPLYATGPEGTAPLRIQNLLWLAYVFLMFTCVLYAAGWLSCRVPRLRQAVQGEPIPRPLAALLPALALLLLVSPNAFRVSEMARSDLEGEVLPAFCEAVQNRREIYSDKEAEPRFQLVSRRPQSFATGNFLTWMPDVLIDDVAVDFPCYHVCGGEITFVALPTVQKFFPKTTDWTEEEFSRTFLLGGEPCVPLREVIDRLGYTISYASKLDTIR